MLNQKLKNIYDGWKGLVWKDERMKTFAETRATICAPCGYNAANICKACGCFIPAKIKAKGASCPKKLWNNVTDEELNNINITK